MVNRLEIVSIKFSVFLKTIVTPVPSQERSDNVVSMPNDAQSTCLILSGNINLYCQGPRNGREKIILLANINLYCQERERGKVVFC